MAALSYSFLEEFLLNALREHGFDKLSPTDQQAYFPQFMAELERRLGLTLVPYLQDDAAVEFDRLVKNETAPEAWAAFWQKNVPDFQAVVKKVLDQFAAEMSSAFS